VPPTNARGFESEIEACKLGTACEPPTRRSMHAPHFLRVDHLERIPVARTALLLHLDDDEALAPAKDEIQLVTTSARVRCEQPISAKSVVAKSAPLAAIHAAS